MAFVSLYVLMSLVLMTSSVDNAHNDTGNPDESLDDNVHAGNDRHPELMFHMSINQTEEGLGKLVAKIDVNNDGIVSQDELTEWILKSNEIIEEREADSYIGQYDHNNDSQVSWDEYFQHFYGSPTVEFAKNNPDHNEILEFVETDKYRFQCADKNKDGLLSQKELRAFLHPHNYPEMLDYEGKKILKDYDMNNDSKISKEELGHVQYGGVKLSQLQMTRVDRVFDSYDMNKDGQLSEDEVKLWLKPDVAEYARTEASHLIKVSDVNNDSKVTKEEILLSLEHWMKSKATNYGDHVRDEL